MVQLLNMAIWSIQKIGGQFFNSANKQQLQRNNREELERRYNWFPRMDNLITNVYFPAHYQGRLFYTKVDGTNQFFFFSFTYL